MEESVFKRTSANVQKVISACAVNSVSTSNVSQCLNA